MSLRPVGCHIYACIGDLRAANSAYLPFSTLTNFFSLIFLQCIDFLHSVLCQRSLVPDFKLRPVSVSALNPLSVIYSCFRKYNYGYKIKSRLRKREQISNVMIVLSLVGFSPLLYLNFPFSSTYVEVLWIAVTPTTTDPSCHVLSILGSVSQSWFVLSLIIKGSEMPF